VHLRPELFTEKDHAALPVDLTPGDAKVTTAFGGTRVFGPAIVAYR
jgi:hypothetical protein